MSNLWPPDETLVVLLSVFPSQWTQKEKGTKTDVHTNAHTHMHSVGHPHSATQRPSLIQCESFFRATPWIQRGRGRVCPSRAKPGVFSIKAIHPLRQLTELAPFQPSFISPIWSAVCVVYCPASSKTQPSQTKQSLNSRFLNPLPPLNTQAGRIMQTNSVQRRHRDVSIIHHLHSEENEGGGAGGSSSVPQAWFSVIRINRLHTNTEQDGDSCYFLQQ